MKIVLFVEGFTEKKALPAFFKRWLDPRLTERIGIQVVRFEGWSEYYDEIGKKVARSLSGKAGADVAAAIGLLDLYGPTFYPQDKTATAERYDWAKAHLERRVDHPSFRQHFAVHETEAWLLAEPSILPKAVGAALSGKSARPESVNFDEPPAKLPERLYREKLRRSYRKVIDGADLFQALEPGAAHGKCPYLHLMLEDMLALATGALR